MEDAIRLLFNFDNKLFTNKKRKKTYFRRNFCFSIVKFRNFATPLSKLVQCQI